jgi:single-stranded DNA-binding protein
LKKQKNQENEMGLKVNGVVTLTRDAAVQTETANGDWLTIGLASKRKISKEGKQDVDFFEASYLMKNKNSPLLGYLKKGTTIYLDSAEIRADMYKKDDSNKVFNKILIFSFDFINSRKENTDKDMASSYDEDRKPKEPADSPDKPSTEPAKPEIKKEPPIVVPEANNNDNNEQDGYDDEVPF